MTKKALITGITGQDGAYLAELLLSKNYEVFGVIRRVSVSTSQRLDSLCKNKSEYIDRLTLLTGDLSDSAGIVQLVNNIRPDEIYNLAAQSHVSDSFVVPEYTCDVNGLGTLRLLEAIRVSDLVEKTRFYQASTSELFGKARETPQTEKTPFHPRSPYGVAKLYAYWITVNYRESYGIYACNGILFNHESPYRGETFVTRKITYGLSRVKLGFVDCIYLGNLDAKRDWGHAKDYVEMQWLMLQQESPEDFVIATGNQYSVRQFTEIAASELGIDLYWEGEGINEVGIDKKSGKSVVRVDPRYFRPAEVDSLLGDASNAKNKLGWSPKISFHEMIREMVSNDLNLAKRSL